MLLDNLLLRFGEKRIRVAAFALAALLIGLYYFCITRYAINFPYLDDYASILEWLNIYRVTHGFLDRVGMLFAQHNEHRILTDRLITLSDYYLTGLINFKIIILAGNMGLLLILWTFYNTVFSNKSISKVYLLPLVLIVFNFSFFEISFWAMASISNIWVIAFALLSLYLFFQDGRLRFALAVFFAFMATYTSFNGLVTFLAAAFVLLLNGRLLNKKSLIWLGSMVIITGAYFYHYSFMDHSNLGELLKVSSITSIVSYVFAFMGGCYASNVYASSVPIAIVYGAIVFCILLFATYKGFYKSNPVVYAGMLFIIGTAAIAALGRYKFGTSQALSSRYAVYSSVLFASCYLFIVEQYYQRMKVYAFGLMILGIVFFSLDTSRKFLVYQVHNKKSFDLEYAKVTTNQLSNFFYGYPFGDKSIPQRILREVSEAGIFKFHFTDEATLLNRIPDGTFQGLEYKVDDFKLPDDSTWDGGVRVVGWSLVRHINSDSIYRFLCYQDTLGNIRKLFIPQRGNRADVASFYKSDGANYMGSGFATRLGKDNLPPGRYKIMLVVTDGKLKERVDLGRGFGN